MTEEEKEKEFFQTGVKHQDYPKTPEGPYQGITGNQNNMFTYPDNFGGEAVVHPNVPQDPRPGAGKYDGGPFGFTPTFTGSKK